MVQMSAQCLLCKTEKAQISGQMQIIGTGWQHCHTVSIQAHALRTDADIKEYLEFFFKFIQYGSFEN